MAKLDLALNRAARRAALVRALPVVGWGVAGAAVGVTLMHLSPRVTGLAFPWWAEAGVGVVGVGAPLAWAWWNRPGREQVAMTLDERLDLKNRLGSALYARGKDGDPVAAHVVAEGEQVADQARVMAARAYPLRLGPGWLATAGIGVLAAAGILWLPEDPFGWKLRRVQEQQRVEALAKAQQTAKAIAAKAQEEALKQPVAGGDGVNDWQKRMNELATAPLATPEARQAAAVKATRLAEDLRRESEKASKDAKELRAALSKAAPSSGITQAVNDALRRGDLKGAAKAMEDLADRARKGELTPEEQKQLADQMKKLADDVRSAADAANARQGVLDMMSQLVMDNGVPEAKARRIAEDTLKRAELGRRGEQLRKPAADAMRQEGVDSPQSDKTADDIGKIAEDFANQTQAPQPDPQQGQQNPQQGQQNPQQGQQNPQQGQQSGQQQGQQPGQQQGQQSGQQQGQQPGQQQGQQPGQQQGQQPGQQQGQQPGQQQGQQPGQQQGQQPGQQQGQQPGQQQGQQPGQQQGQQQGQQPGQQQGQQPGQQQGGGSSSQQLANELQQLAREAQQGGQPGANAVERMQRSLQRAADAQGAAEAMERMRQWADDMAKNYGQAEQEGEEGGGGGQQQKTGPRGGKGTLDSHLGEEKKGFEHDTAGWNENHRSDSGVISQGTGGTSIGGTTNLTYQQAVEEGRQEMERALGDDGVPDRYHEALREYYRQLPPSGR